ncbi:diguanylate cyclase/phosphodiesterase [Poseidonocella pacifica]|uniref:Diguanylate cyclase/phosphodiesterase n=2 Tax=Poseidonocella pacifica TaxID=871651 RepID=A0A1I0XIU7_9RHOB|nr:diguanylate cyclase/phosphodiesterase [Poseidonocella pacifica]
MLLASFMRIRRVAALLFSGPQVIAFTPAVSLGAFWIGGEGALLAASLGYPMIYMLFAPEGWVPHETVSRRDAVTGLPLREFMLERLDDYFEISANRARNGACMLIELTNAAHVETTFGSEVLSELRRAVADRLRAALRDNDMVYCLTDDRFGLVLGTTTNLDLEAGIQLSNRLLRTVQDPIKVGSNTIYPSSCLGFCLANVSPEPTGEALMDAAQSALLSAMKSGESTIRAYAPDTIRAAAKVDNNAREVIEALEDGRITAWFQPQVSTDTGLVSGFEALARWIHPEKGPIGPSSFIPALEAAGRMEQLGDIILRHSLLALRKWDAAGFDVPSISVNFSEVELSNPRLVDKVRWELDRNELPPERLTVEIVESVVTADPNNLVTRNIAGLAALGCTVDLDDFGTGNASIAAIRQFDINRIKIDRSYVSRIDRDPEQQRLISAIITMAEQLGLQTVAEGVETQGEHALISQLGCDHAQGFALARPMALDNTFGWMEQHYAHLLPIPQIGGRAF